MCIPVSAPESIPRRRDQSLHQGCQRCHLKDKRAKFGIPKECGIHIGGQGCQNDKLKFNKNWSTLEIIKCISKFGSHNPCALDLYVALEICRLCNRYSIIIAPNNSHCLSIQTGVSIHCRFLCT